MSFFGQCSGPIRPICLVERKGEFPDVLRKHIEGWFDYLEPIMRHLGADLGGPMASMRSEMRADLRPKTANSRAE